MLHTHNITFQYPLANPIFYPDVHCDAGESLLILGESGVGKSTLLHILGALLKPVAGDLRINDTDVNALNEREKDAFRGKNIGIVFQKPHFINALTVKENLEFTRKLAGLPKDSKRIKSLLDDLAIPHKASSKPDELSQGEMQRVSIARALINKPSIILADEPTSALDNKNSERVISLLKDHAKQQNSALIIVTHDQRIEREFSKTLLLTFENQKR